jgi:predicted nucleic acid-binding protein
VTPTVVCDASALVALLLDSGADGQWATRALTGVALVAPALLAFEAANIIRRSELAGTVSADQASQAHDDLVDVEIEFWPYELLLPRVWELRHNLSSYDASYVSLAEMAQAPLITLDRRIARAPGVRCSVTTPEQP